MRTPAHVFLLAALLGAACGDAAPPEPPAPELFDAANRAVGEERWDEAIELYRRSVEVGGLAPDADEHARYTLGALLLEHRPPEEVVAYFARTAETDPKPQTSHYYWALALEKAGRAAEAIEHFERAVEIDPAHELTELAWGELLEREGDLEGALRHMERSVEIYPEFRPALRAAARVLDALGRRGEAAERRAQARAADPDTPRRFLYWARALLAADRPRAALRELERAALAMPGDREVEELLETTRARLAAEDGAGAGDGRQ